MKLSTSKELILLSLIIQGHVQSASSIREVRQLKAEVSQVLFGEHIFIFGNFNLTKFSRKITFFAFIRMLLGTFRIRLILRIKEDLQKVARISLFVVAQNICDVDLPTMGGRCTLDDVVQVGEDLRLRFAVNGQGVKVDRAGYRGRESGLVNANL